MVKRGVSPSRPDGGAGAAKKPKGTKPRASKATRDDKNGKSGLERMLAAHGLPENGDLQSDDNMTRLRAMTCNQLTTLCGLVDLYGPKGGKVKGDKDALMETKGSLETQLRLEVSHKDDPCNMILP